MEIEKLMYYTAMMLQDQAIIQAIRSGDCENTHSMMKMQMAIFETFSEVSKLYPVYRKKKVVTDDGLIARSKVASEGFFTVSSVTADGKAVPYTVNNNGIQTEGPGTYEIVYSPEIFDLDINDAVDVAPEVGFVMLMNLVARNYCMLSGRTEEAALYDSLYNEYMENVRLRRKAQLKARKFL